MPWNSFKPRNRLVTQANQAQVDAQLAWADGTDFAHLVRGQQALEQIPVLVELAKGGRAGDFAKKVKAADGHVPIIKGITDGLGYCTASLKEQFLKGLLAAPSGHGVRRVELQMPVIPQRPRPLREPARLSDAELPRLKSDTDVLLGVIDSACPFAHPHFRLGSSTLEHPATRILNLWVQDDAALSDPGEIQSRTPADFRYGREVNRKAMNRLMRECTLKSGPVDEAACYARAGAQSLRSRFTHGSAVLDLLAAPVPLSARMNQAGDPPPTWASEDKQADKADIVFVQLPQDTVQDSSSASLARHLLDGLHYIVSCASEKTERIVVNISDGSQRGSHDGDSIFERALVALLEAEPRLHVVLAAGNSFNESRHAQWNHLEKDKPREVIVRIPPDCESPAFVFARIPAKFARNVKLCVARVGVDTVPGGGGSVQQGQAKALYPPDPAGQPPICTVIYPTPLDTGHAVVAMIVWAPTRMTDPRFIGTAGGEWRIDVSSDRPVPSPVHLYITRNQTNSGALPRGRQARFIDASGAYDPRRHLDPLEDDPAPPTSPIRRRGSLSSLATARHSRLTVVGAYMFREGVPSLYSSEGPSASEKKGGGGLEPRPLAWAPADTHRALDGVRALGGLAGTVLRVAGTSFAAPQSARHIANREDLLEELPQTRRPSRMGPK